LAFARTDGLAVTISELAIISETVNPAPNRATRRRNGRSVIPASGDRNTGGFRMIFATFIDKCLIPVQLTCSYPVHRHLAIQPRR